MLQPPPLIAGVSSISQPQTQPTIKLQPTASINQLYGRAENMKDLPAAYSNHELMRPVAAHFLGGTRFPGIRKELLLDQMCFVNSLMQKAQRGCLLRADVTDRTHLTTSLHVLQPLLPLDNIKQTSADIQSTFAQFCTFVALFESPPDATRASFPPELLLSPARLQAFIAFFILAGKAPQTIKNKALHLQQGLHELESDPDLDHLLPQIRQALKVVKDAARDAGKAFSSRLTDKPTEELLLSRGQFFYPEERPIFSRWLILGKSFP